MITKERASLLIEKFGELSKMELAYQITDQDIEFLQFYVEEVKKFTNMPEGISTFVEVNELIVGEYVKIRRDSRIDLLDI